MISSTQCEMNWLLIVNNATYVNRLKVIRNKNIHFSLKVSEKSDFENIRKFISF